MVFGSCDGCGRGSPYGPFASTVPDGRCSLGIGNRFNVCRYG